MAETNMPITTEQLLTEAPGASTHLIAGPHEGAFESLKGQAVYPFPPPHPGFSPEGPDQQPPFPDAVPSSPAQFYPGRSASPFSIAQGGAMAGDDSSRSKTSVAVLSDLEHEHGHGHGHGHGHEHALLGQSLPRASSPPTSKVFHDQDSLNKYLRRRAKNNEAATKSRKKKRELEEANFLKAKELAEENAKLKEELQALRAETKTLKDMFNMMWQAKK